MRGLLVRGAVVMTGVALLGTACDNEADALTKEEWTKAADAICKTADDGFEKLFETDFPTTPEKTADFFKKATPVVETEMADLRDLEPPDDIADDVDKALDLGDKGVEDFKAAETDADKATELFGSEGGENLTAWGNAFEDLGAAGCNAEEGDEEGEGEENLPDPSTFSAEKKAYIEAADPTCEEEQAVRFPAENEAFETFPPPIETWATFLEVVVAAQEEWLAAFEAIEPPAEDAETIADIVSKVRDRLDATKELKAAADAGDQDALDAALQPLIGGGFEEADNAMRAYGFQVCGAENPNG